MKEMSTFQIVSLAVFGFFAIFGLLVFSGGIPIGDDDGADVQGTVTIWGLLPQVDTRSVIETTFANNRKITVQYTQKSATNFDRELVEALASGQGPDIVLLPHDLILRHQDKVIPFPYETISSRDFRNRFVQEGELYLTDNGAIALPLVVDPLVMYWNRDLFASAGLPQAPTVWSDLYNVVDLLHTHTPDGTITQSGVALGEYRNITHAKEILSLLMLQAGTPITERTDKGDVANRFDMRINNEVNPSISAVNFYTGFALSDKQNYTWNRALPFAQDMFVAGNLGIYFGFASERPLLARRNPRLNFDVAVVPQIQDATNRVAYGNIHGAAVLKNTNNYPLAGYVATQLADASVSQQLARGLSIAPASRSVLGKPGNDPYSPVFYESALISKGWLDPNPTETETIFKNMVEDVTSGRLKVSAAVSAAASQLNQLLDN